MPDTYIKRLTCKDYGAPCNRLNLDHVFPFPNSLFLILWFDLNLFFPACIYNLSWKEVEYFARNKPLVFFQALSYEDTCIPSRTIDSASVLKEIFYWVNDCKTNRWPPLPTCNRKHSHSFKLKGPCGAKLTQDWWVCWCVENGYISSDVGLREMPAHLMKSFNCCI